MVGYGRDYAISEAMASTSGVAIGGAIAPVPLAGYSVIRRLSLY
jgi:hypothetical protein